LSSDLRDVGGRPPAPPHRHLPHSKSPSRSPQRSVAHRPEGKRPSLSVRRDPDVRIAHISDAMLAEAGVIEPDFRKRNEGKPGSTSR